MKIAFFDSHNFERSAFETGNGALKAPHEIDFLRVQLSHETAPLGLHYPAICAFVNDRLDRYIINMLADGGLKLVALRSAGYNNVDLDACREHNIKVVHVPAYSPYAVAEHALTLLMALNRKIHRAYNRVRELDFSLSGLVGFDLNGKTVGIVGTGRIGAILCRIMWGLGTKVLAYDPYKNEELVKQFGVEYVDLETLYRESDIISLQIPLLESTRYMINEKAISQMKPGVFIINTGRGALIDTKALIEGLKNKKIGGAGLDVYEEEEGIFFRNLSETGLQDDVLARLLTFPNVIVTAHQAFLTKEAIQNIATTTLQNISDFEAGKPLVNAVKG